MLVMAFQMDVYIYIYIKVLFLFVLTLLQSHSQYKVSLATSCDDHLALEYPENVLTRIH